MVGLYKSLAIGVLVSFVLTGCSESVKFVSKRPSLKKTDTPGSDGDPSGPGAIDPNTCPSGSSRSESFNLETAGIEGSNILFWIDDSGSMTGEFQKVVWEVRGFIDQVNAATNNNFRIAMVFDIHADAIEGRTFYRDRDANGNGINPINNPNPFYDQIAAGDVEYIEQETWSKLSDVGFARAFMPLDFMQILPAFVPLDTPYGGGRGRRITNHDRDTPYGGGTVYSPANCSGPGKYFRPRQNTSTYGYGSPGCIQAVNTAGRLEDHFLPDYNLNIVAISDDDLNVQFDRNNFSVTDPTKNAYPEIIDGLISQLIAPLGTDYFYNSIVGPIGSRIQSPSTIELDGVAHLALTKKTNGVSFDIRENSWAELFDQLANQVIFSGQRLRTACNPNPTTIEVTFNGNVVDPENYRLDIPNHRINFLPRAFLGFEIGDPIAVTITYDNR